MLEPVWVVNLPDSAVKVAAPFFASTFALFPIVKSPVLAVTFTVLPEIVPSISPDWLEVVTLLVPLIVEPTVEVNLPLSAVIVTVLPEILPTARVAPVATSVTEPELDSTLPLISPVLVVIFALPVVALMVEPAVVVKAPASAVTVTS
ncbi:hypothetical protein BV065_01330 [Haemophilus influenzae]|nr:hypothetical protein BV065_01330 [Haemophilus influenzae]